MRPSASLLKLIALSALTADQPLPTEFRIFAKGWNDSTKGRVLFDDQAARDVMAIYAKHGVDGAIDLEHDSTSPEARVFRNDAADARGYYKLELRAGELWAVQVSWADDGEARIRSGRQRFISPYFLFDKKTGRVHELVNLALVAQPATDHATPLAAGRFSTMDPKIITEALDALIAGDTKKCADLLKQLVASAAGGEAADQAEDQAPGDPMAQGADAAAPGAVPPPSADPAKPGAVKASAMPTAGELAEALASLRLVTQGWDALRTQIGGLVAEKNARDLAERKTLVASLVELGVETPALAWSNAEKAELCPRLLSESLESLRARVAAFSALPRNPLRPPTVGQGQLSSEEEAIAARMPADKRDAYRALRLSRQAHS